MGTEDINRETTEDQILAYLSQMTNNSNSLVSLLEKMSQDIKSMVDELKKLEYYARTKR